MDILFTIYQIASIFFFIFLSMVLLYHRLFKRWLKFSLGFFVVYVVGSLVFFQRFPFTLKAEQLEAFLMSLPYLLFYIGTPAFIGFLLYRGLTLAQLLGATVVFLGFLLALLVFTTNYFDKPFGFFYDFTPHARAWIEIGSVLLLFLGTPAMLGSCLIRALSIGQTFGVMLSFLAFVGLVAALIQLTMGYEFLSQVLGR